MNTTDANDTKGCMFVYLAEEFPLRSGFEIMALSIFTPIIVALGSIFNLAFLFVLYRIEEMHTLCNFYLANLAVADLGSLLSFGPHYIAQYINSPKFEVQHVGFAASKDCVLDGWFTFYVAYAAYYASLFFLSLYLIVTWLFVFH